MANVNVTVSGNAVFFTTVMDDAAIPAYVAAAQVAGVFVSTALDIYIPFVNSVLVSTPLTFAQASRDDVENFGPTP